MKTFIMAAGLSLVAATAYAGGYVAPVVEATPVVEAKEAFTWTGAYAGATIGKTGTTLDFSGVDGFGESISSKIDDDATTYGVFAGYRHQFNNNAVVGVEANYAKTENFFEVDGTEVWGVEAQAGYAFGRVLPYAAVGYGKVWGEEAVSWSVGADYAVTDNVVAGVKYTRTDLGDFDVNDAASAFTGFNADVDTVALRVGYKF